MFKIIALVTLLTGQPVDVLVSRNTTTNCPNEEALERIRTELQDGLDIQDGSHKHVIIKAKCVTVDKLQEEARRFLTQRGS